MADDIDRKLDAVLARLEAWQPYIDGIRVLQSAVEVLQHDVRAIRGDITSLKEINARVRQLEEHDRDPPHG
jgi:hypothetical protein